jgi:hypothetical protein
LGLRIILTAASLHSLGLGLVLSLYTRFFLEITGYGPQTGIFYPQQSGVFLFILGIGYGIAARDPDRHRGLVTLTIISKGLAVIFLYYHVLIVQAPSLILLAALGDTAFFLLLVLFAWANYEQKKS